jgi:hypothetical protein
MRVLAVTCFLLIPEKGRADSAGIECITEMSLPRYTHTARRSRTGGTVRATVTVGQHGIPAKVETISPDPDIAEEVTKYLTKATTYSATCSGKLVQVIFTFTLEGEPEFDPPVWIRFRPPNHFLIFSTPRKPNVN